MRTGPALSPSFPPRGLALVAAGLALIAGCGRAPAPDLSTDLADVERLRAEAEAFGPDSTARAMLDAAGRDADAARRLADARDAPGAGRAVRTALATARVGLAATAAAERELAADNCLQSAAEARREWRDALHLLEQAEKVAGREARGITREDAEEPDGGGTPAWDFAPMADLRAADVDALLARAGALDGAAREQRVPSADLAGVRGRALAAGGAEKVLPEDRHAWLVVAARSVEEQAQRLRADAAARRCRDALATARTYAGYRDQALWGLVELERSMKENVRRELDAERARMEDRQSELYKALQQFEGKFASIRQEARGTIMSLSDILFDFDKATLKRDAEFNLVRVSTILQQFPEMHIYIEGHTDNIGTEAYNKKLSERRAQAVFDFLTQQGVDQDRMDWFGYGMAQPVAPNNTEAGRAKNRRVDLVIGEE